MSEAILTVTDAARAKLRDVLEAEERRGQGVRIAIQGKSLGGFQYEFTFVGPGDAREDDTLVDCGAFQVHVDPRSLPNLQGATVDYVDSVQGGGIQIDNPNAAWADPISRKVADVIEQQINPGVAQHGGVVELLDVRENKVFLRFGGGCQGCGMVDFTLKEGVEKMIREQVPEIVGIFDVTDHASGENPYYQPSAK